MLWRIVRALLFMFPAETAHSIGGMMLSVINCLGPIRRNTNLRGGLQRRFCGQALSSPVGLAAGFDKDAKYIPALSRLGFGFVEIGTVTPEPQPGNPKPRLFRLPHSQALVNRLGFNSEGAESVRARLAKLKEGPGYPFPVGVNIGKNRNTSLENAGVDYLKGLDAFYSVADFFVINLSSPNTPGLRQLLDESHLAPLIKKISERARELGKKEAGAPRELFLKISPDMEASDRKRAVELAMEVGFQGIVATNTTIRRDLPGMASADARVAAEQGGLSGLPLQGLAGQHVKEIRNWMGAGKTLISVGGIFTVEEAERRLADGADLLEIYTGFIYNGPGFPRDLARKLGH